MLSCDPFRSGVRSVVCVVSVSVLQNGNNETTIKIQLNRSLNVLNAMAVHDLLNEFGWFNDDYYFCFHIKKRNVRTSNFASPTTDYVMLSILLMTHDGCFF